MAAIPGCTVSRRSGPVTPGMPLSAGCGIFGFAGATASAGRFAAADGATVDDGAVCEATSAFVSSGNVADDFMSRPPDWLNQ